MMCDDAGMIDVDPCLLYFQRQSEAAGSNVRVHQFWTECCNLFAKKLWHQLSELFVSQCYADDESSPQLGIGAHLIDITYDVYDNAIRHLEARLNPLSLVKIASTVLRRMCDQPDDMSQALLNAMKFIDRVADKVRSSKPSESSIIVGVTQASVVHNEALVLARILEARLTLLQSNLADKPVVVLKEAKLIISECETRLRSECGLNGSYVHRIFHFTACDLWRRMANHSAFYQAALNYLGCCPVSSPADVSDQQKQLATHMCLAALLAKDVYNFGQLLAHPVVASLDKDDWLLQTVFAFNAGDVMKFKSAVFREQWERNPDLKAAEQFLTDKIATLAVMDMAFERKSVIADDGSCNANMMDEDDSSSNPSQLGSQCMKLTDIMHRTGLGQHKVELLVIKALAQELIKGYIDQLTGHVYITWVQSRVLDTLQLTRLVDRLDQWTKQVDSLHSQIQSEASDVLLAAG